MPDIEIVELQSQRIVGMIAETSMATIGNVTFACADPALLCRFWTAALGYAEQEAPPGFREAWLAAGRPGLGAGDGPQRRLAAAPCAIGQHQRCAGTQPRSRRMAKISALLFRLLMTPLIMAAPPL